jgi:ubiquitin carboxyl-terminal hydrolase L3
MKQTIPNACGTIAVLHALLNFSELLVNEDSPLAELKQSLFLKTPEERAHILEKHKVIYFQYRFPTGFS